MDWNNWFIHKYKYEIRTVEYSRKTYKCELKFKKFIGCQGNNQEGKVVFKTEAYISNTKIWFYFAEITNEKKVY